MAYPTKRDLDYSYTGFEQSQGDGSFPGHQVDDDLANLKTTSDETVDFLESAFRSDGVLKVAAMPTAGDLTEYTEEAAASAAAAAADVVLTHADVVLTHADVVLTHADVVLTHADVVAAGNSASAAAASAGSILAVAGKVYVSAADTTANYLNNTVAVAGLLSKAITNPAADETLTLTVTAATNAHVDGGTDTAEAVTSAGAKRAARIWAQRGAFWGSIVNNVSDANNDIDFNHDVASDDSDPVQIAVTLTKRLDAAWAAGTNQGGLFTGAKANSTWYHCFVIRDVTNGLVDCGFDTSITAANRPVAYTKYRRVGSILTDSSGNLLAFSQNGRDFRWLTPTLDISAASQATGTPTLRALKVPSGLKVKAAFTAVFNNSTATSAGLIVAPDVTTQTASSSVSPLYNQGVSSGGATAVSNGLMHNIWTNTAQQVTTNALSATSTLNIVTHGWEDPLGVFN